MFGASPYTDPIFTCSYIRADRTEAVTEFYLLDGNYQPRSIGLEASIPLDNAFYIVRNWLPNSDNLHQNLASTLQWSETYAKVGAKVLKSPRLLHLMGDLNVCYINNWEENCKRLRDNIHVETGLNYNSAMLTMYRTGIDHIPYHRDRTVRDQWRHNPIPSTATILLGTSRRFYLRDHVTKSVIKVMINSGDLIMMTGDIHQTHMQSIPRLGAKIGPSITVGLRCLTL